MPKPNYQFEKRRRDLDKKAKKDEKRRRKLEGDSRPAGEATTAPETETGTV
jgi:hypothetical protein